MQHFDEEALGVYFVIFSFFTMIVTLQKTFQILLIPNFISLLKNNDIKNLKKSIRLFGKYMTIMNSLLIVTGIIFGEFFLIGGSQGWIVFLLVIIFGKPGTSERYLLVERIQPGDSIISFCIKNQ